MDYNTIKSEKSFNTAVVIVPELIDQECLSVLDGFRRKYDRWYSQWRLLNIKILYPFVVRGDVDVDDIAECLYPFSPFSLDYSQFDISEISSGYRLALTPDDETILRAIRENLMETYVACRDMEFAGFHITLGHFDTLEECEERLNELRESITSIGVTINSVNVLNCEENGRPLESLYVVPFDGKIIDNSDQNKSISSFKRMPVFFHSEGEWKEYTEKIVDIPVPVIKIVTWNILFDMFDKELIHTRERYPRLLEYLSGIDADIIGLEEVTQKFLVMILREKWVQENYFVSDSFAFGATVKPYGQLILSKNPFDLHLHNYSKHKKAVVAEYLFNGRTLYIPVVHLTSNSSNNRTSQRRAYQLGIIYDKICPSLDEDDLTDTIIMGDFNISDNEEGEDIVLRSDFLDAWKELNPGLPGYTFDPTNNSMASVTSSRSTPRRYDRMLIRSFYDLWKPISIDIIGTEPFMIMDKGKEVHLTMSDHFGLYCVLHFDKDGEKVKREFIENIVSLKDVSFKTKDKKIIQQLEDRNAIETEDGNIKREEALQLLGSLLPKSCRLDTVGSFRIGTHSPSSDIDTVCLGNNSRNEFWRYVKKHVASHSQVRLKKLLKSAIVPVAKLTVNGIEIDLTYARLYCQISRDTNLFSISDSEIRKMTSECVRSLNGYRDSASLVRAIPNIEKYRVAARVINLWAKSKNIYSSKIGYLGGFGWSVMLANVAISYPRSNSSELVYKFFELYSQWDFGKRPVILSISPCPVYRVGKFDRMTVVTLCKPYKNICRNVTLSTLEVIQNEITTTFHELQNNNWEYLFEEIDFFNLFKSYLCIEVDALSSSEFYGWVEWIESRIIDLIIKLENLSSNIIVQPSILRYKRKKDSGFPYSCALYIGISIQTNPDGTKDAINFGSAVDEFVNGLNEWQKSTQGMFVKVKHVKQNQLQNIQIFHLEDTNEIITNDTEEENQVQGGKIGIGISDMPINYDAKPGKIPSCDKVLHKIVWDPRFEESHFVIGYEDRFLGIIEIAVEDFKKNKDIIGIPFHRVEYFRIPEIDLKVWDKPTRTYLLD